LKGLLFLALDAKGGVCSQFIMWGWCVYLHIYLSILEIVDMYEPICVVRWLVNLFKFVRLICASVEPWLSTCDACCFSLWWFAFHVMCMTVSISHLCTCVCELSVKRLLNVW
jgi:hypothetical protein